MFQEEEEEGTANIFKGDKLQQLFTFYETEKLRRVITSVQWSPKVREPFS